MKAITAISILMLSTISAEARQRGQVRAPECDVTMPCVFAYAPSKRVIERSTRRLRVVERVRRSKVVEHRRQKARQVRLAPAGRPLPTEVVHTPGKPLRYIPGRLICAVNVGSALAERGIRGTGSASAMSYLYWGKSAGGPRVGAVIVSARRGGGHVAIVSRITNGVVYAWNATGGQRGWREIAYRQHVIDYRVPG